MSKPRRKRSAKLQKPVAKPVDIRGTLNFPGRSVRGKFLRALAEDVQGFPCGSQSPWGLPFEMASPRRKARVILLRAGDEVTVPVGEQANYVCLLHTFRKAPNDGTEYLEARAVGEYEIIYTEGRSPVSPVRARLDVPVPESPGPAQLSVPFTMPRTADPAAPPAHFNWGWLQCGIKGGGPEDPLVYALKNPHPNMEIEALVIRGLAKSELIVAGITCFSGTSHPFRHLARRMYRVATADGAPVQVEEVEVDMGAVARTDHTIGRRGAAWLRAPYAGVDDTAEPVEGKEAIYSIYGAADATVSARLGGRKQWMQVEIIDSSSGKPTAVRIHMSGARGEYIAPHGHHEQVNTNWFEDYGADVKVSGRSYAYVPGEFVTDLPTGPLYVEMTKGFEYVPTRCKVTVAPGQKVLRLTIDRWKDLRSQGWVTADTHVHFLSPQTAWLEAQGEGVNVVNLLATQ